jgi:hypothetical protein
LVIAVSSGPTSSAFANIYIYKIHYFLRF